MNGVPPRSAPLLTLACRHSYFADQVCRPLRVRPSAQSAAWLRCRGLLVRPVAGGIELYGTLPEQDEAVALTFTLENSDPWLMNYTAAPALAEPPGRAAWYFGQSGDGAGTLNAVSGTEGSALSKLAVRSGRFSHALGTVREVDSLRLLDAAGDEVWSLPLPAPQPMSSVAVVADGLADGRYTLQVNGTPELDFYLCAQPPAAMWGVVSVTLRAADYVIALQARSTIWRYVVVADQQDADYRGYAVSGSYLKPGSPAIAFHNVPDLLPVAGRAAARFASSAPVPMCERPAQAMRFILQTDASGSGRQVNLPYAQGTVLAAPDAVSTGVAYSDIYIYL